MKQRRRAAGSRGIALQAVIQVPLVASIVAAAVPVEDDTTSSIPRLRQCLADSDAAGLRRCHEHRRLTFLDILRPRLHEWVNSRAGRPAVGAARTEADVAFLLDALGPGTLPWLQSLRDWDATTCASYEDLQHELTTFEHREDLGADGWPDQLETLFFEVQDLGALSLLAPRFAQLAFRASGVGLDETAELLIDELEEYAHDHDDGRLHAWCHRTRGQTAWIQNDLELADHHLALAVDRYAQLEDWGMACDAAVQWASLRINRGHLRAAEAAAERAERLSVGLDSILQRQVIEVQAAILVEWGDYEAAVQRLSGLQETSGTRPAEVDVRLALLHGSILDEVGRLDDAEIQTQLAVRLAEHPGLRRAVPQLYYEALTAHGLTLGDHGRFEQAMQALDTADRGFRDAGNERGAAWVAKNRGWVLRNADQIPAAMESFHAGHQFGQEAGSLFLEGWCALGLAESALELPERPREWSSWIGNARTVGQQLQDEHLLWRVAACEGQAFERDGAIDDAHARYTEAVHQIERLRRRLIRPGLLSHYLRNKVDPYQGATMTAARLGRFEEAFHLAELIRARHYSESGPGTSGPTPVSPQRRRELADAHASVRAAPDRAARMRAQQYLVELERRTQEERLDAELIQADGPLPHTPRDRPRLADILPALERHGIDACLEYMVGADETLVFVLRPDGMQTRRLPIGHAWIAEHVQSILEPIHALGRAEIDLAHLDFDVPAARRLYDSLVRPIAADLGTRIAVVPDGPLEPLPFGLLVSEGRPTRRDPEQPFAELHPLRFLASERICSVLPSASCLVELVEPKSWPPGGPLAVFATDHHRSASPEWEQLPGLAMQALGSGMDVRLFPRTGRSTVLEQSPGAAWLHFAAHGRARHDAPAHAALILQSEEGGEQRLESWEVQGLSLRADLVVLAACHSAVGPSLPGEGTLSLTRSFLLAGASQVISSHWAVDDHATSTFMTTFYRHVLAGEDPATAIARTQRDLMAREDDRGLALTHPYFWAAWTCHRGGRPVPDHDRNASLEPSGRNDPAPGETRTRVKPSR